MENYFVEGLHPYAQQQVRIALKRFREEDEACGGYQARRASEQANLAPYTKLSKAELAKMNLETSKKAAAATARAETYEADLSTISVTSMKTVAMAMKRSEELETQLANVTEQLKKAKAENALLSAANSRAELAFKEHALERHVGEYLKGLWEVLVSPQIKGPSVAMSIITDSRCGLFDMYEWNQDDYWMTSRNKGHDLQVATPLRYAVLADRLDVLKEIVAAIQATGHSIKDALNLFVNHRNPTLVFLAAEHGFVEVLRYLIALGADAQVTNSGSATPLHRAASQGSVECVEILLAAGCPLFAPTIDGDHPIHYAASCGHGPVIRKLLEFRNPLTARNKYRCSPLDNALQNGDAETIQLLRSVTRYR